VLVTFRLDRFELRELIRREHAAQGLYQLLIMLPLFGFTLCTLLLENALHFGLLRIIET
jgi:hypothetical protein